MNFKGYRIIFTLLLFPVFTFGQNFWNAVHLPDSVEPKSIYAEVPGYLYAVGQGDGFTGIYRSVDRGFSWEYITRDILWLGGRIAKINDSSIISSTGGVVYRSDDYGDNWYPVCYDTYLERLKSDQYGNVYSLGWGVLLRSADGGYSWDTLLTSNNTHCFGDLAFGDTGQIFLATYRFMGPPHGGFYRSMDNGETFEHIGLVNMHVLELEITSDQVLYAGVSYGMQKSYDLGETWIPFNDSISGSPFNITPEDVMTCGWNVNHHMPFYRSENLGISWKDVSAGITNTRAYYFSLSPDGYLYLFCIYKPYLDDNIFISSNPIVSIDDVPMKKDVFYMYPNPCTDFISVILPIEFVNDKSKIRIFDLSGRILISEEISGELQPKINIKTLPSGTYILNVRTPICDEVDKFIKVGK